MAPLPDRAAGHRPALGDCGSRPIRTCASTPTTTRWTRGWSAGASRSASTSARSLAVALDTGELACRHQRSRSRRHRTITALEHARALRERARRTAPSRAVEIRPLARYDALIA